jgi:hypothetical protein
MITETHSAPSLVPIESDKEFFGKSGPVPATVDDSRRFPRFYYRAYVPATIYPIKPGEAEPQQCTILTRDLSRGGISFLHIGQLFPGQRLDVVLNDGVKRAVEVQWCRRLRDRCYLGGCRFIKAEDEQPVEPPADAAPVPPPASTAPPDDPHLARTA